MGIKEKLMAGDAGVLAYGGATPPTMKGASDNSALHSTYSINGLPPTPKKPEPSILDLNGQVPSNNYKDNLPEGASF